MTLPVSSGIESGGAGTSRGGQLYRLTSLRFIAAMGVFLYHVAKTTDWLPQDVLFRYGFTGVGFFFILSGFVLTWSSKHDMTRKDFYVRRFARVYPSHFVVFVAALFVPVIAFPLSVGGAVANLALVQAWFMDWAIVFSLNAVSWSLSCEAFFYLCSPFLIRHLGNAGTRALIIVSSGWVALTFMLSLWLGLRGNTWDIWAYTNPLLRSGEFMIGVALALLIRRGWTPRVPLSASILALGCVMALAALTRGQLPQTVANVVFAPFFALVIVAAATADLRGKQGLMQWRPLRYAGEVSFAFYLVHEVVILNAWAWAADLSLGRGAGLLLCIGVFMVSCLASVALHHGVELRAQGMILRWWRLRRLSGSRRQLAENMEER